ncbi:MAG: hypothetical protein ABIU54_11160 [Candidatus Eisenbacteria bacterium]
MNRTRLGHIHWVSLLLLTLPTGMVCSGRLALAQAPAAASTVSASAAALAQAQALYDQSDFSASQSLLREKLASGVISGKEVRPARELLARSLVRSGNRVEAKEAFKGVIRRFPGYRPDAGKVPPDEQEVFAMAEREVLAEQIETGRRIPASLSFSIGTGSADNEDMGKVIDFLDELYDSGDSTAVTGHKYDGKLQFGGAVRFPIRERLSIEVELQSLHASTSLKPADFEGRSIGFDVSGLPLSVSLYQAVLSGRSFRLNVFAGGGVLATAISEVDYSELKDILGVPVKLSGQKTGSYFHGGLEAEYLVTQRFSLSGRLLGRSAKAKGTLDGIGFGEEFNGRTIDFSGFGATLGLRAYIGY